MRSLLRPIGSLIKNLTERFRDLTLRKLYLRIWACKSKTFLQDRLMARFFWFEKWPESNSASWPTCDQEQYFLQNLAKIIFHINYHYNNDTAIVIINRIIAGNFSKYSKIGSYVANWRQACQQVNSQSTHDKYYNTFLLMLSAFRPRCRRHYKEIIKSSTPNEDEEQDHSARHVWVVVIKTFNLWGRQKSCSCNYRSKNKQKNDLAAKTTNHKFGEKI